MAEHAQSISFQWCISKLRSKPLSAKTKHCAWIRTRVQKFRRIQHARRTNWHEWELELPWQHYGRWWRQRVVWPLIGTGPDAKLRRRGRRSLGHGWQLTNQRSFAAIKKFTINQTDKLLQNFYICLDNLSDMIKLNHYFSKTCIIESVILLLYSYCYCL